MPVLARYHGRLLAAAAFAGDGFVTGGTSPSRQNLTTPLVTSLAGGVGCPAWTPAWPRATWLAEGAALIGLGAFMAAAGISCSQRLGDLAAGLEPAAEEHAVALLGALRS